MANDIQTRLVVDTDTQSVNKARSSIKRMGDDLDAFVKQQDDYIEKQKQVKRAVEETTQAEERASRARKNSSTLDAGRGVIGNPKLANIEAGFSGLISIADGFDPSNILSAADAIPKLGQGLKSLPSAFSNILSIVNPLTIGLVAVAGAFKIVLDESERQAQELNRRIEATRDINQQLARGLTTDAATAQIDALRAQVQAETKTLKSLEQAYAEFEANTPAVAQLIAKGLFPTEEELFQQIEKSKSIIDGFTVSIDGLESAIKRGDTAINDKNTALLENARLVADGLRVEIEANERTAEQNRQRLEAIEQQKTIIEAEIEVLREAGDTSAIVTARIGELEKQLASLGNETEIVSRFTTQTAKDRADAEKKSADERIRTVEDMARRTEQAEKGRADALLALNNRLEDIATKVANDEEDRARQLADSRSDARLKLERDLIGLEEKQRQSIHDLIIKAQADEAKSARNHQRAMRKIQADAQAQREDLVANLDFAGLYRLERDTNARLEAQAQAYAEEREERQIALEAQLADLQISQAIERRERLVAYQQQLADLKTQADRQRRDREIAFKREDEMARLAYDRQLKLLTERFNAETKLYTEAGKNIQQVIQKSLNAGSTTTPRIGIQAPTTSSISAPVPGTQLLNSVLRTSNTTHNNAVAININGAQHPNNTAAAVRDELRRLGLGG